MKTVIVQGFSTIFVLFLGLTILRQIPQLFITVTKRKNESKSYGHYSTIVFYIVYLWIWPMSGLFIWRGVAVDFWLGSGFFFLIAGILIRFLALKELGRFFASGIEIQRDHKLIQTGIYSLCRHPLYLSLLLELLGMVLISHQIHLFLLWIILIPVVHDRNKKEDLILCQTVKGAELYQKRVPSMNILAGAFQRIRGLVKEVPESR